MTLTREIIAVLSNLGTVQGLFLAIYLLLLKNGNKRANHMLAFLLLALTVRVGKSVLNHYLDLEPWQRNLGLAGFLAVGPFLLLYGKALWKQKWKPGFKDYLHFIPSFLYVAFCFLIPNTSDLLSYISYCLVLLQLVVYCFFSYRSLHQVKTAIDKEIYTWYKRLIYGVFLVWLLYLMIFIGIIPFYMAGAIFYSVLIYTFSYMLLKRHVFQLQKYRNSPLNGQEASKVLDALEDVFNTRKLYLKNDLTLGEMAETLSVSPRVLSQVINQHTGKNFSEYINNFRIEEAKQLLTDPDMEGEKITAIAFDCGFSNITSFNQTFKSHTLLTPTQFRKQFLKDS